MIKTVILKISDNWVLTMDKFCVSKSPGSQYFGTYNNSSVVNTTPLRLIYRHNIMENWLICGQTGAMIRTLSQFLNIPVTINYERRIHWDESKVERFADVFVDMTDFSLKKYQSPDVQFGSPLGHTYYLSILSAKIADHGINSMSHLFGIFDSYLWSLITLLLILFSIIELINTFITRTTNNKHIYGKFYVS